MKQIRKITNPIIKSVEKVLNRALDNVYLNTALKVFLILYAALAAPKFPPKLAFLMDNVFVRIGVSFLIVFMAIRDPGIALMIAVAFVITLQTANKLRLMDGSLSQALPGETSWLPSAKEGFFNGEDATAVADDAAADAETVVDLLKAIEVAETDEEVIAAGDKLREAIMGNQEVYDALIGFLENDDLDSVWKGGDTEEIEAAVGVILNQ